MLHYAIEKQNIPLLQTILRYHPELDNLNSHGDAPIIFACKQRRFDFLKLLLEGGASVNVHDNHGNTLLHLLLQDMPDGKEMVL